MTRMEYTIKPKFDKGEHVQNPLIIINGARHMVWVQLCSSW